MYIAMKNDSLKQPIPFFTEVPVSRPYKTLPVDLHDPRSTEPLVNIAAYGIAGESYYARRDGRNAPYNQPLAGALDVVLCREGVARRLADINQALAPLGLELFVWDAYRPITCQQGIWDYMSHKVTAEHPGIDAATHDRLVGRYVSDPRRFKANDPLTWTPHSTGGAVDLTLRHADTQKLADMGTHFDDLSDLSHRDHFEHALAEGLVAPDDVRLINRRILHNAMVGAGFASHPYEYWHFDWGNQLYLRHLEYQPASAGKIPPHAWYGYAPYPA